MNKFMLAVASIASIVAAPMASAQTWTGPAVWAWEGNVVVQKGDSLPFPCKLRVEIVNPGTGSTTVTNGANGVQLSAGYFACPAIQIGNGPGPLSVPSAVLGPQPLNVTYAATPESFSLSNVYAITPTYGDCAGSISAIFNDSPDSLTVNTFLPAVVGGSGNCTITGTLPLVSAGPVDIS